jgi:hypothetical protein
MNGLNLTQSKKTLELSLGLRFVYDREIRMDVMSIRGNFGMFIVAFEDGVFALLVRENEIDTEIFRTKEVELLIGKLEWL